MLDVLTCKECGAAPRGMKLCHDLFDDLLGMKYLGNGEAYRIAVACYTFQHPATQPPKAWRYAHDMLIQLVDQKRSLKEAYERAEESATPSTAQPPIPPATIWKLTIMDFADHLMQDPTTFARQRAASLLQSYRVYTQQLQAQGDDPA